MQVKIAVGIMIESTSRNLWGAEPGVMKLMRYRPTPSGGNSPLSGGSTIAPRVGKPRFYSSIVSLGYVIVVSPVTVISLVYSSIVPGYSADTDQYSDVAGDAYD